MSVRFSGMVNHQTFRMWVCAVAMRDIAVGSAAGARGRMQKLRRRIT
jgi:ribosomal protein L28